MRIPLSKTIICKLQKPGKQAMFAGDKEDIQYMTTNLKKYVKMESIYGHPQDNLFKHRQ